MESFVYGATMIDLETHVFKHFQLQLKMEGGGIENQLQGKKTLKTNI